MHEGQPGAERGTLDLARQAQHGNGRPSRSANAAIAATTASACAASARDRVIQRAVRLDVADVGAARDECGRAAAATLRVSSAESIAIAMRPKFAAVGIGRMRADGDPEPLARSTASRIEAASPA